MKRYLAAFLVLATLACEGTREPMAPATMQDGHGLGGDIANQMVRHFIVVLQDSADPEAVAREHGVQPEKVFHNVVSGFAGRISDAARAGLLRDGRVRNIVPNQIFSSDDNSTPAASWGLDRVDQRSSTLDGTYHYVATGKGVTAYILDTGIRYSHVDFGGRASFGFDAWGGDGSDCYGHGTHVAGTVGGTVYGVAKEVSLVSVRVADCSGMGSTETVVAGLDWVLSHVQRPAVVNMSLGGDVDTVVDEAVSRVIAAGIPVVASAGNSNIDACLHSPARVPEAMTVGASTLYDDRANFSNYGDCVDWYAPGWLVASDFYTSDSAISALSGTSMAAPHTTGAAALYLEQHPDASSAEVAAAIGSWVTSHVIATGKPGGKADLLYTLVGEPTGNVAPSASFTASCTDTSCSFTDGSIDADGSVTAWAWDFGDGATASTQDPSHAYAAPGTYYVTLTVTDDGGATGNTAQQVDAWGPTSGNAPPNAAFTVSCTRLSCSFTDASSDPDGSLVRWQWDYSDGTSTMVEAATTEPHTFAAGGIYPVTLTVTDNDGATSTTSQQVAAGVVLTAVGYKQRGRHQIDLSWEGAESSRVDIYVDGTRLVTVDTSAGPFTYVTDNRGQGSYDIRVCEEGSDYCSRTVNVAF